MKFTDIPQATRDGNYCVHIDWQSLERQILSYTEERTLAKLDLNPDFQRGRVWTHEQQVAYVEAKLSGRIKIDILRANCVGWMGSFKGPFVLVDGLQRLTAARLFVNNELAVFNGVKRSDFEDHIPSDVSFAFQVNALKTRREVLQWYIDLNTGGTPHSNEEIDRVKSLLATEVEARRNKA